MLMETNREKKARGKAKIILWFMYKILPSCKLIDIKFKQFVLSIFTFIDA